jgi:hypothetical protein
MFIRYGMAANDDQRGVAAAGSGLVVWRQARIEGEELFVCAPAVQPLWAMLLVPVAAISFRRVALLVHGHARRAK